MLGFAFHEIMEGSVVRTGERFDRPFRFEVDVTTPRLFSRVADCHAEGFVQLHGLAKHARATGRLELSPLFERRIRYVLDFHDDGGAPCQFDGEKRIARFGALPHVLLRTWTTLSGVVTRGGETWGRALLRFHLRRDLRALAESVRVGPASLLEARHA